MKQISDLLRHKGRDVWSLSPDATVYEAIDQMAQKEVGALLVMEGEKLVGIISERDYARKVFLKGKSSKDTQLVMEGDKLVGIISERDYARKVFLKGKSSKETQVREIMSYPVICVPPELTVERTMTLMSATTLAKCFSRENRPRRHRFARSCLIRSSAFRRNSRSNGR